MRPVLLTVFAALLLGFSACEKDEGTMASSGVSITFRTDSGYTYANDSVPQGDTVRIGAIINEGSDPLEWFILSVSLDSAVAEGVDTVNININPFNYEAAHVTRMQSGTEQLIFIVQEPDGDITTRRLTLTVP